MSWHATLSLDYALRNSKTVAQFRHDGPLRILQSLCPEGNTVCHNVLVHTAGGWSVAIRFTYRSLLRLAATD